MLFDFFRKRKTYIEDYEEERAQRNGYAPLVPEEDPEVVRKREIAMAASRKHTAVQRCEELIDAVRVLDDLKSEYQLVTAYLNDIQKIEEMDPRQREPITEAARQIGKLDTARNQFLNKEHTLSDYQYAQFQEEERDMPGIIRRFQSNEAYLEAIQKDMRLLEGEKVEWEMLKEDQLEEQKTLRRMSVGVLILAAGVVLLLTLLYFVMEMDTQLYMLIVAFLVVLYSSYAIIRYQESNREIKKSEINRNQAISLENHVKIKYVTIKNAVDYTCTKYKVTNSRELIYNFEQYQEMLKEKQRFRQTSDDLIYYSERLVRLLENENMYDSRIWLHYISALMEPKEMVELKHSMLTRRQQVRSQIENQMETVKQLREEIAGYVYESGADMKQVAQVLRQIDALNIL
ncbi:MAG: hypothetical protein PUB52_04335 [Lachnospiraceae bacterium]|nr:hypothetical protein [Lachnospiraceae bacterium]